MRVRDEMEPGARPAAIVPRTFAEAQAMCLALAKSGLVPRDYIDHPENMIVTVMSGAEIGIPPMAAIRLYHLMDGVPRLSAEGIRAVIMSHPAIDYFEVATCDDTQATWIGRRRGRPEKSVTWTIDRAKRAGLLDRKNRDGSPGNWQKYTQDMLNARASMQLGRLIAPEIIAGMVSREEALDGDFIDAQATERPAAVAFSAPPAAVVQAIRDQPTQPIPTTTSPAAVSGQARARKKNEPAVNEHDATPNRPTAAPAAPAAPSGASSPQSESPPAALESSGNSTTLRPSVEPTGSSQISAATSKLDAAVKAVEEKLAERPTSGGGGPAPVSSTASTSEPPFAANMDSIAETARQVDDSFGGDDPVDSAPAEPADLALHKVEVEFAAFLAGCANQREMSKGFPAWRAWSAEQFKGGDRRFAEKTGELSGRMAKMWATRKSEVPA